MELIDTIKYFAKYPLKAAVLDNFKGHTVAGYSDLKTYVEGLTEHSLIPELLSFIVSYDEVQIEKQIKRIDGYFMYLEFSNISSSAVDQFRNRNSESIVSIIIAHKIDAQSMDTMAQAVISDTCLTYIKKLIDFMKADDALTCGNKRLTDNAINIQAVPPWLLYQSLGWELSIRKRNNLML